ncbi:hypothetical protein MIMGU_mgv1a017591mg [Erythranthe guttata]|uniref:Uncharacterized protein n=1 Tax=Erythranthe guttata TaxID=4155 RepID=A0A022RCT5_ERYGU|nr:hypothetical protein MIMGU_mgv1a017591mg [Erythranthe guttata]
MVEFVRCSKYLYTLCVFDPEKADKLKQSLPPGLFECARPVSLEFDIIGVWNSKDIRLYFFFPEFW